MDSMTVRRIRFDYDPEMELVFVPDDARTSLSFLGAWMMLPYLEPYLIRSLRAAADELAGTKPELADDIRMFCAQEAMHHKEHARANRVIKQRIPAFSVLDAMEAELKKTYERFTETKSLRWNLAYAEAFEALTTASARAQFELRMFDPLVAPLGDLFAWHIMEELEHRTVAFEALEAVESSYLYRVVVGTRCLFHYLGTSARFAKAMRRAAPELEARPVGKDQKRRRDQVRMSFLKRVLPKWLSIFRPTYHPRKLALPPNFHEVQARYDALAS